MIGDTLMSKQQTFVDHFDATASSLPGAEITWLNRARKTALDHFDRVGFPTRRVEEWKYTDLSFLNGSEFDLTSIASQADKPKHLPNELAALDAFRVCFVDGRLRHDLSTIEGLDAGIEIHSLSEALDLGIDGLEAHLGKFPENPAGAVQALNAALMTDGVVVRCADNAVASKPIVIEILSSGDCGSANAQVRNVLISGANSMVDVIECYGGPGDQTYFNNIVNDLSIGADARVRWTKVQIEGERSTHLSSTNIGLGEGADFKGFYFSAGAKLSRTQVDVSMDGERGHVELHGVFLVDGDRHCDTTTVMDHRVPHCDSDQVFKGVLKDEGHGVFQGLVHVHPDAQKTNGNQLVKSLILSDRAEMDAKPELKIYADDVLCSHGATTGDLDEDALFYLQSRGLDEQTARGMLISAFVVETLEKLENAELRGMCEALLADWLSKVD